MGKNASYLRPFKKLLTRGQELVSNNAVRGVPATATQKATSIKDTADPAFFKSELPAVNPGKNGPAGDITFTPPEATPQHFTPIRTAVPQDNLNVSFGRVDDAITPTTTLDSAPTGPARSIPSEKVDPNSIDVNVGGRSSDSLNMGNKDTIGSTFNQPAPKEALKTSPDGGYGGATRRDQDILKQEAGGINDVPSTGAATGDAKKPSYAGNFDEADPRSLRGDDALLWADKTLSDNAMPEGFGGVLGALWNNTMEKAGRFALGHRGMTKLEQLRYAKEIKSGLVNIDPSAQEYLKGMWEKLSRSYPGMIEQNPGLANLFAIGGGSAAAIGAMALLKNMGKPSMSQMFANPAVIGAGIGGLALGKMGD